MSTIELHTQQLNPTLRVACDECDGLCRLVGIEPHPTRAHTDLRTYECLACEAMQTVAVSLVV